jgi:hypothetical protein
VATKKTSAKASPKASTKEKAAPAQGAGLLATLQARFEAHPKRHPGISWADVQARLEGNKTALAVLQRMEDTGGEPDVVAVDKKTGALTFFDCAAESPTGRRSICYDRAALDARKEAKPRSSAEDMAREIGITLLNEEQYRFLQTLGVFDAKTSSWVLTPAAVRKHGGALFSDHRYAHTFVYHNGAESYYGARGFRGALTV